MAVLTVTHATTYRYRRPVGFEEHRLMFRPRDSHDLRLINTSLITSPPADIRWYHDVFGNSIAIATFRDRAERLFIKSTIVIEHYGMDAPEFPIEPYARHLPFSYPSEEVPDLGRTIERHYPDPDHRVDAWTHQFLNDSGPTDTSVLLTELTRAIGDSFVYEPRDEAGVRTPIETLDRGSGSCRDFVLLMMEAARSLGLAARFVSGYLYDPALDGADAGVVGAGSTHAWVQIYLPGAGWIECDPTNGIVGGANLIRVGVAREPAQAVSLDGTYIGAPDDFIDLSVDVTVRAGPPS